MRKKLFRRIYNDDNIPDDDLLHIFFDSSMLRMDISSYDSSLSKTYSKFFDAYSQAKLKRVFPKDLASFIDSFLVEPKDFNIHTCHPFNSSDDRYFFDYEEDEDHIYFWLNVSRNFSRGDIFMDEKSNTSVVTADNQESTPKTNENGDTSLMPAPIAEVAGEQTNIATLTAEIKMYLHIANQSIIEVGKRLIIAKEMLPYGEWKNWLTQNFNLKERMAQRFMEISRRFSEPSTSTVLDISTFKASTLVELLALPKGDEQKFIAEKAAEGNPADQMTIKQLRAEVKKWKDGFATSEKSNQGLESYISTLRNELLYYRKELDTTKDRARTLSKQLAIQKNVEVPPPDYEDLQREVQELRDRPIEFALPDDYESSKQELAALKAREDSFKHDYTVTHALEQIFSVIPTLLNADNLQNVVSDAAIHDLQSFELHLSQMAKLHSQLQKYLAAWQDDPIYKRPIDRVAIISELKQIIVQDSSTRTSSKIEDLISSLGYKKLLDIPDELLPDLLKKVRNF